MTLSQKCDSKVCTRCKEKKLLSGFYFNKRKDTNKIYYQSWCKECMREYYKNDGKAISNKGKKAWNARNPEKRKKVSLTYYYQNKDKVNARERNRVKTDLKHRLNKLIANGLRLAIKNKHHIHWEKIVGYTVEQLKNHLEGTIPAGATWKDFLQGRLHIDHIKPKCLFKISEVKECWALTNLQLLWEKDNRLKSSTYSI